MFQGRTQRDDAVRTELKRHLLVRSQTVEQRDRCVDCFKIQVADWILQALEETGKRLAINVGLASERHRALDRLPVCQIKVFSARTSQNFTDTASLRQAVRAWMHADMFPALSRMTPGNEPKFLRTQLSLSPSHCVIRSQSMDGGVPSTTGCIRDRCAW